MEEETKAIAALPDDDLAGVLRVLPPRSLAVARSVCKAWRNIIDARGLLLAHLLPHSVRGVFVNYIDHDRPHLFSRPCSSSTFPGIDGLLSFVPNDDNRRDWWTVLDHCNGLVLCNINWESQLCVCNPATQRWTILPEDNTELSRRLPCAYIAFDPIVSPHDEVFLIPDVPEKPKTTAPSVQPQAEQMIDEPFYLDWLFPSPEGAADQADEYQQDPHRFTEWPPSPWSLKVFSSRTRQWEDRSFVRESQPVGTVEEMRLHPHEPTWQGPRQRYAVYHNGGHYVHCRGSFVARFSLSNDKYQVIKMPIEEKDVKSYLGRSKDGVCFGIVYNQQLRVWKLSDSCGNMEWLLKYEANIMLYASYIAALPYTNGRQPDGSWMVEEDNSENETGSEESIECDSDSDEYNSDVSDIDENIETKSNESIEWDSDNDDIITVEAKVQRFSI
ncbi:hypothetical protein QOZ80_4BG0359360 [Eleusine coracana subsp. coracana]|nr:hypothetical protein QOZ80_4BG0359360 [Eleusine coracana subsp. coracana]